VSETSSKIVSGLERYTLATEEYRSRAGNVDGAALSEEGSDRILITLLALNLILLAFFVVLNASSSFDVDRVRAVAASARSSLFTDFEERKKVEALSYQTALSDFRDSIADQFASILSPEQSATIVPGIRVASDRVEVDVPATIFFQSDGTLYAPLPTLDGLATVMGTPPAGYRAELAIRGTESSAQHEAMFARMAALANALVARGVSATVMSAGLLSEVSVGTETVARDPTLRFSFLLLSADDDRRHAPRLNVIESANEEVGR
jgi:hypothetical protein